jgi:hypothetical protein
VRKGTERDLFKDAGVDGIIYLLKSFITIVSVILAYVYFVQTQSLSFVSHVGDVFISSGFSPAHLSLCYLVYASRKIRDIAHFLYTSHKELCA